VNANFVHETEGIDERGTGKRKGQPCNLPLAEEEIIDDLAHIPQTLKSALRLC
jgi:hypothetical protein